MPPAPVAGRGALFSSWCWLSDGESGDGGVMRLQYGWHLMDAQV